MVTWVPIPNNSGDICRCNQNCHAQKICPCCVFSATKGSLVQCGQVLDLLDVFVLIFFKSYRQEKLLRPLWLISKEVLPRPVREIRFSLGSQCTEQQPQARLIVFFSRNVQTVSIMPCSVLAPEKWQIKANGKSRQMAIQKQQFTMPSFPIVVLGYGGTCMMPTIRMQQKKIAVWFATLCNTHTV